MSVHPAAAVQPFCVGVAPGGREVVAALTGELDIDSCDVLEREIRKLRLAGFDRVVVDLSDLEFIDSTGLRLLISLRNTAEREGHELTIVPGRRQVQRIFELTATRGLFHWRD